MLKRTLPLAIVTLALLTSGCHIWLRPAVVCSIGYPYPPPSAPPPYWWYDYWSYYYWSSPYWCFYHHWHCHHWVWVNVHYHYYEWWPDPPGRYKWGYWARHKKYKRGRYPGRWRTGTEGKKWTKRSKDPGSPSVHQIALPNAGKSPGRTIEKPEPLRGTTYVQRGPLNEQERGAPKQATTTPKLAESSRHQQTEDRIPSSTQSASATRSLRESPQATDRRSEMARITGTSVTERERPGQEKTKPKDSPQPKSRGSDVIELSPDVAPEAEPAIVQKKASGESPRTTRNRSGAVTSAREGATPTERSVSERKSTKDSRQSMPSRPQDRGTSSERRSFSQAARNTGANPYVRSRTPKRTAGSSPSGRRR